MNFPLVHLDFDIKVLTGWYLDIVSYREVNFLYRIHIYLHFCILWLKCQVKTVTSCTMYEWIFWITCHTFLPLFTLMSDYYSCKRTCSNISCAYKLHICHVGRNRDCGGRLWWWWSLLHKSGLQGCAMSPLRKWRILNGWLLDWILAVDDMLD